MINKHLIICIKNWYNVYLGVKTILLQYKNENNYIWSHTKKIKNNDFKINCKSQTYLWQVS